SFFEKHFVSGEADRAASDAYRRADACAAVFRSTDTFCGGEAGDSCPPGYECAGIDESITDGQGDCFRIAGYVAKRGERCGGPDKIGCEPGTSCTKRYQEIGSGIVDERCTLDSSPSASASASGSK